MIIDIERHRNKGPKPTIASSNPRRIQVNLRENLSRLFFFFILVVGAHLPNANASYVLYFSPVSASSTGSPIVVNLYLRDDAIVSDLETYGAAGASYQVNLSGVGSLATPTPNALFDVATATGSGASAQVVQTSILGLNGTPNAGAIDLLIGSFTINSTVSGNGNLTITGIGSHADISVYNNALVPQVLDASIFTPTPTFNYSFEITAVPEPSSIAGAIGLAGFGSWYLWRRRKSKQA